MDLLFACAGAALDSGFFCATPEADRVMAARAVASGRATMSAAIVAVADFLAAQRDVVH
jgi:hypothetical protein